MQIETEAQLMRDKARAAAKILARRGHRRAWISRLLRSINVIVGVAIVVVTFVPILRGLVGVRGVEVAAAVAGAVLIADVLLPTLLGGHPPDLYFIYSFYTDSYASQIEQILLESPQNQRDTDMRFGRLSELLRHARLNFDDIHARFPGVLDGATPEPRR